MGIELVDPTTCRMWDLHDRLGDELTVDSCRSLIRSFQQNGQKHPVLARTRAGECERSYELIYGARRLFAARHLGMGLLIDVRDFDDRTALIEMDIENRVRRDISAYDRGLSYARWLRAGHFDSQAALARRLGVSEAQISRVLRYAELPTAVVAAFRSPRDIREEWAVTLAKCCAQSDVRQRVIRRARGYAASQRRYPPQAIYALLIDTGPGKPQRRSRNEVMKSADGSPFMQVSFRAKTVHLILPRNTATPSVLRDITEHVRRLVNGRKTEPSAQAAAARVTGARLNVAESSRYTDRSQRAADN